MILQALTRYYEDLLAQGKIDAPGWVPAKISFALYLDETGELTQVVPTMEDVTKGKKTVRQPQAGRFSVFAGVPGRFCAAGSFQRICGSIRAQNRPKRAKRGTLGTTKAPDLEDA